MHKKQQLLELCQKTLDEFEKEKSNPVIVPNSFPILWFGDYEAYAASPRKIVTISLNPSSAEFKPRGENQFDAKFRFPAYDGSPESMYYAYNEYFKPGRNNYSKWFKASFSSVLAGFSASHYPDGQSVALHTDIGSPFATDPTWSGLNFRQKEALEPFGKAIWNQLIDVLEPDLVLFSASRGFESKIDRTHIDANWEITEGIVLKTPLLRRRFKTTSGKPFWAMFQVQGRMPFLQVKKELKETYHHYINFSQL